MTEEKKDDKVVEPKVEEIIEQKEEETPEHSEIELRAMGMGWRPEAQWQGDGEFIDAGEFVRRKPLFDKIEHQGRKVKQLEDAVNNLAVHNERIRQMEYNRALQDLKHERRAALKEGDNETVVNIEDRIDELAHSYAQQTPQQQRQVPAGPTPEFQTWVQHNNWYLSNKKMQMFADGAAMNYQRQNPNANPSEVFSYVDSQVREQFQNVFENPNRNRPGAVNSGEKGGKSPKVEFKLSDEQERIARTFEQMGGITRAEYIKQLAELAKQEV